MNEGVDSEEENSVDIFQHVEFIIVVRSSTFDLSFLIHIIYIIIGIFKPVIVVRSYMAATAVVVKLI